MQPISSIARQILAVVLASCFVIPQGFAAQQPRAEPVVQGTRPSVSGPSRLSAADVDQLKAAASAKGSKVLVVGTIERVEKRGFWSFYLATEGPAVYIRVVQFEIARLERRFGTADLAGKTIKVMSPYVSVENNGVEVSLTTTVSEGGEANFEVIDGQKSMASVHIKHPVASGPLECDNWRAFDSEICLAAERRLAESGDAAAMGRLGWRYVERRKGVFAPDAGRPNQGTGVTQNNKEAVRWLQAGARAGDRRAMANLGFFYTEGLGGLPKDDVEAVKWFRRGADAGDRRAMASLGLMYVLGRGGLKQDDTSAVRLFRAAAVDEDPMVVEGDAQAMLHLGLHYLMGRGVAQNDAEAVRWMTRAMQRNSVHGYPMAALNLGVLYATGAAGVPKNLGQASVLFGAGNATYADALGAPELFELGNGTSDQMYATLARYRQAADNQRNPQSLSGGQLLLLAGAFVVIVAALSNGGRALPPSTTSDLLTHERNPMCDFPMTFDEAGVFGLFGAGC